jgi:nitrogenase molybdenum-cofactor synthesis protein NifE
MKGLYKVLPPFAPDYSGVCSVLFELGGIVVIHDGGGCTGNFTGYDEPRWYGSSSAVFSSELREIEAIVGDDEKLLCKLEDAVHTLRGRFVAIVGSPAPMVVGTDYRAIAHILSERIGLEVLIFDTNGIRYYDDGASMAFLELARRFVKPVSRSAEYGVNIIGATPLDIGNGQHAGRLTSLLADAGCRVVSCWAMGSTLDDIAQSAQARLNIVVSRAGLEAARYMECEHGIPYLVGIPIGREPGRRFIGSVRSLLGLERDPGTPEKAVASAAGINDALVIGEQVLSNAVRDCLRMDLGLDKITVASFFGMDPALMEEGDICFDCEERLTAVTSKHQYDVVVGDPLYRDLVTPSRKCHFVEFPHIALSSRLFWDGDFDYIGMEGIHYIEKKLKKIE